MTNTGVLANRPVWQEPKSTMVDQQIALGGHGQSREEGELPEVERPRKGFPR